MIVECKDYIKSVLQDITQIPNEKVFLSAKDEAGYNIAQWISILSMKAKPKKNICNERTMDESGKFILVRKRYEIEQPFKVAVSGPDELTVDRWMHTLLENIASGIKVGNAWVDIEIIDIDYADKNSKIRSQYLAAMTVVCSYAVYKQRSMNRITEISVNTVDYQEGEIS